MQTMMDVRRIPFSSCPLCGTQGLSVVHGKNAEGAREPDQVHCSTCGMSLLLGEDARSVRFETIPGPYAYFGDYYSQWAPSDEAAQLAEAIRENSDAALSYLPDAKRYAWNLRIILGAEGDADADSVELDLQWDDRPGSKDEARSELARIRSMEDRIHPVIREMQQMMDELRARYSGDREDPAARNTALKPYRDTTRLADELLSEMDAAKEYLERWIDEQD